MQAQQRSPNNNPDLLIIILISVSFILWGYCFRGFISGYYVIESDAKAYYEHFEFLIRNVAHGEYPMWESTRNGGVPSEFFMRRIGSFNPLYVFILILFKLGVSFRASYIAFLTAYYFLGMTGFYLLMRRIFDDSALAFCAFLILLFSSLGTRLFDSYVLLTIIPLIWFFYFLVSFAFQQKRHFLLGITFTLMILFTTYIPFYFIIIFGTFLVCYVLFYFKQCQSIMGEILKFFKENKFFVFICFAAVLISLIPGISFYLETKQGDIVMPSRGGSALGMTSSFLEVGVPTVTSWGILEDFSYAMLFLDFERFKFAVLYLPLFSLILFLLCFFSRISKRLIFLSCWALGIFLMLSPYSFIYHWLYEHIFFFKFFRNLHFFLWMALLPIYVIVITEQFLNFIMQFQKGKRDRIKALIILLVIHSGVGLFIYHWGGSNPSSYISLFFSFLFFSLFASNKIQHHQVIFYILLFAAIVLQPIEAYAYLGMNARKSLGEPTEKYKGTEPYRRFYLSDENINELILRRHQSQQTNPQLKMFADSPSAMYFGTKWFDILRRNVPHKLIDDYLAWEIILYDRVEAAGAENFDLGRSLRSFYYFENIAFIPKAAKVPEGFLSEQVADYAQVITKKSPDIKVLDFGVNFLKLKTRMDTNKLLVYNDNFHRNWRATIDDKKVDIVRANISFKGLWLPKGEHVVHFRFGSNWRYILNYSMILVFNVIFYLLLFLILKHNFMDNQKCGVEGA